MFTGSIVIGMHNLLFFQGKLFKDVPEGYWLMSLLPHL